MLDKAQLAKFDIFSNVAQDKLSVIAQACELLEFAENDVIFSEEDTAENLCGVIDGEVELSIMFKDHVLKAVPLKDIKYEEENLSRLEIFEKPIVVDTIESGEIFGWSSSVSPGLRTATARCSKASKVFAISGAKLKAMFDENPAMGYAIMEKMSEIIAKRLKNRTDKLVEAWGQAFGVDKV